MPGRTGQKGKRDLTVAKQAGPGLRALFKLAEHQLQGTIRFEPGAAGGLACRVQFPEKPDSQGGGS